MKKTEKILAIMLSLALLLTTITTPILAEETGTTENVTGDNPETTPVIEESLTESEVAEEAAVNEEIEATTETTTTATEDLTSEDATAVEAAVTTIETEVTTMETQLTTAEKKGYDIEAKKLIVAKIKLLVVKIKKAHKDKDKVQLKKLQTELKLLIKDLKIIKIKIKKEKIKHHAIEKEIVPKGCVSWFDGCNTCSVKNGAPDACTLMACDETTMKEAKCLEFKEEVPSIELPKDCVSWFDGCNKCMVKDGIVTGCTKMACKTMKEAKCLKSIAKKIDDKENMKENMMEKCSIENGETCDKINCPAGKEGCAECLNNHGKNCDKKTCSETDKKEHKCGQKMKMKMKKEILEENLQKFKAENRSDFKDFLESVNEEHQTDIQKTLENFNEIKQTDFIAKHKKFGDKLDKMVKHLPYVPMAKRDAFLNKKLDVLGKAENLDKTIKGLKVSAEKMKRAEEMLTMVEEYNFDALTADKVNNKIDEFIKKATETGVDTATIEAEIERLKAEAESFKSESKKQKFDQGIIPFKDTDDNEWFTEYVSYVKDKSIVGGYKDNNGKDLGEFRPSNNVTVAEVLKMALEAAGVDVKNVTGTPKNTIAAQHWAKNYFKAAEDLGLNITNDINLDPNRLANRGEIIRLALEALKITPEAVTAVDFTDVKVTDLNAPYIQYAKKTGVISGDAGKGTFRPEAPITRAEIAKILKNMIEILKTTVDVTE